MGTDINDAFLATARGARFGQWALRSVSPEQKQAYFTQTSEKAQWQLRPEYRSSVRFERHNLLSLLDGTSPLQFTDFDLILCRNVLIYFHPDVVGRVVKGLREALCEGGWMLLGHAEPNPAFSDMMRAVNLPGTTAYRHLPARPHSDEISQPLAPVWISPPALTPPVVPMQKRSRESLPPPAPAAPAAAPKNDATDTHSVLAEVRTLANSGQLETAAAACEKGLALHPVCPLLHFYRGLVAQALRQSSEAEKAFRQSLYLDKKFVMAHYHLGLHLVSTGETERGERSIAHALRVAASLPPDTCLAEADGVTAGEFRSLSRMSPHPTRRSSR